MKEDARGLRFCLAQSLLSSAAGPSGESRSRDALYCSCACDKYLGHRSLLSCYTDGHAAT